MDLNNLMKTYTLVDVERSSVNKTLTPVERRTKLIGSITEQIKMVNAELAGREFSVMVTDKTGAEKKKIVKHWYWAARNGKVYVGINYGPNTIKIGMHNQIEVSSLRELPALFEAIIDVVNTGQLDEAIAAAAVAPARKPKAA